MVDHGVAQPPWRQLAAILRARIESGAYPPGGRLPSIKGLAQEHGLAEVTVRKAITALRDEGLIETVSGWGSFVKDG